MTPASDLHTHLATARLVGSPAHAAARSALAARLATLGFTVTRHTFAAPLGRRGENLIAARPGAVPRVWLVAHYDTKGQRFSMAGRLVAVAVALGGAAGLVALGLATAVGARVGTELWWLTSAVAITGGVASSLLGLRNDSPGALDNGTGVRAVLAAAERLGNDSTVGVILPDAEELGLVGARALAREQPELFRDAAVINLDGLDDQGPMFALVHRAGSVTDAVCAALGARCWRWLPVLVDGIPLGRVAREAVTILRGNLATMRIVHTPRDTAARLTYAGADAIAGTIVRVLRGPPPPSFGP